MGQRSKVVGFLSLAPGGRAGWDPSLAFVLAGAVGPSTFLLFFSLPLRVKKSRAFCTVPAWIPHTVAENF